MTPARELMSAALPQAQAWEYSAAEMISADTSMSGRRAEPCMHAADMLGHAGLVLMLPSATERRLLAGRAGFWAGPGIPAYVCAEWDGTGGDLPCGVRADGVTLSEAFDWGSAESWTRSPAAVGALSAMPTRAAWDGTRLPCRVYVKDSDVVDGCTWNWLSAGGRLLLGGAGSSELRDFNRDAPGLWTSLTRIDGRGMNWLLPDGSFLCPEWAEQAERSSAGAGLRRCSGLGGRPGTSYVGNDGRDAFGGALAWDSPFRPRGFRGPARAKAWSWTGTFILPEMPLGTDPKWHGTVPLALARRQDGTWNWARADGGGPLSARTYDAATGFHDMSPYLPPDDAKDLHVYGSAYGLRGGRWRRVLPDGSELPLRAAGETAGYCEERAAWDVPEEVRSWRRPAPGDARQWRAKASLERNARNAWKRSGGGPRP